VPRLYPGLSTGRGARVGGQRRCPLMSAPVCRRPSGRQPRGMAVLGRRVTGASRVLRAWAERGRACRPIVPARARNRASRWAPTIQVASRLGSPCRLDCDAHPLWLRVCAWNGRGSGSHMTDFQTEELHGVAPSVSVPKDRTPLAHDAGATTLHLAWLWLTTGGGLIVTAVCMSAAVSIVLAWTFVSGLLYRDRTEEGRVILQRVLDLTALQTGSQSALGCLDVGSGDPLEEICERTIFASPESVAGANSFVAARLSVLGDALAYANGAHSHRAGVVALRQAVENDQFGIVAHVLAARYGCSTSQCSAFVLFNDTSKVIANLNARTFENLVARYALNWQGQGGPGQSPTPAVPMVSALPGRFPPVAAPLSEPPVNSRGGGAVKGLRVPPASSIPAVSIMTEEPRATGTPSTTSGSAQHQPASPRSSPRTPPPTPLSPPVQLSRDPPNPS
jgi:hypothetical protein